MSVRLTVCIVAYNNYEDIKEALASMEAYTSPKLLKRIYIVDNGVDVVTPLKVIEFQNYLSKINDVEYINAGENVGFGRGHNKILSMIDSDYHAIVNPDVLFCSDAFTKIVEWMDENPNVGMTIPYITDEEGNRQEVYRRELTVFDVVNRFFLKGIFRKRFNTHVMKEMDFTKPFQVPFGQGSFLVIRSDLFKELGGFDDNFFMYVEDADLCRRVNEVSKLMFFPDARVIHKWEAGSHKNKTLFKYHMQSFRYYFKKWGLKIF